MANNESDQRCEGKEHVMANVVLVHGLWVDGSSWSLVARKLMNHGHSVTVVQLPLSSLEDDIAVVQRALAQQRGPVALVGHSYGGAVISAASHGADDVAALVYVAAVAIGPDESPGAVLEKYPASEGLRAIVADADGYIVLDPARFPELFADDVPRQEAEVLAVSQGPAAGACLAQSVEKVGWQERPSWYVLCTRDRIVTPEAQQGVADRIGAKVFVSEASHAVVRSRPNDVVEAIEDALTYAHG
ncbi:alpha/beta hydrolase [Streptomyces collinus]|uniref:alpha/beta hydrolase n=1 Tax=Streptomyces collinus TaxID=42684 RepID=UPI002943CA8D|nr:alpha/beta hydrolase [Streptomyces collinus]